MPDHRAETFARLADHPLDVLVVGGGATGVGVALDASDRGYRVGLVEREDLASGTSSRSSKLIHGGLRYLATGDLPMVVEGVQEREVLRRVAPHLVRPLGFVVPTDTCADAVQLRTGLVLYDAVALGRGARPHRRLRPDEVLMDAPGLVRGLRRGGFRYDDAQTDDARLVLAVAAAARQHGALVSPHTEAVELLRARGRVRGARVRDRLTGEEHVVPARWVVHAGGVWVDEAADLAPGASPAGIRRAKGVHLTLRGTDLPVRRAIVLPSGHADGRRVFVVPWGAQVYVGTTDDLEAVGVDRPQVTEPDARYLLEAVNGAFGTDLAVDDAIGAWAGWRPLVAGEGATADQSRRHAIAEPVPGLVTVTGGKLTTYRRMAEDVVDHLAAGDGVRRRSRTRRIPLGASGTARDGLARTRRVVERLGADPALAGSLYHRHGDRAPAVVTACAEAGPAGLVPLVPQLPYLAGEVAWAVDEEWARTVADVLERRMRVSIRHDAAGGAAVQRVADVLAERLGWDEDERVRQVGAYLDAVGAERGPVPLRPA